MFNRFNQKSMLSAALSAALVMGALSGASQALAENKIKQTFSANIAGVTFESDDDGVLAVPLKDSLTISASTKGFSAYPPPAGKSDEVRFTCKWFGGAAKNYTPKDFQDEVCFATYVKGKSKKPFGEPEAEYKVSRKSLTKSSVEITKVAGKVIEGTFSLEMVDDKGKKIVITDGKFKVEDRQL